MYAYSKRYARLEIFAEKHAGWVILVVSMCQDDPVRATGGCSHHVEYVLKEGARTNSITWDFVLTHPIQFSSVHSHLFLRSPGNTGPRCLKGKAILLFFFFKFFFVFFVIVFFFKTNSRRIGASGGCSRRCRTSGSNTVSFWFFGT